MSIILVVGATGTLGRQVARRALDEGYTVRCLVRNYKRASFLKEWGAELVLGDLCDPPTLPPALEGVDAVIDAATSRPTDSLTIKEVDWDGKVALIQAAKQAGVERYIFFSILNAAKYPQVPLMEIKRCTERFLEQSGLDYTILRPCGFLQGLIGQYAIPILDRQVVWVTSESAPTAFMDSQDVAKFATRALQVPETKNRSFPVVGSRAWQAGEIINLCEQLSGQQAKVSRVPVNFLRLMRRIMRFFQWGWNAADRLAFVEVLASNEPFSADMQETYEVFGLDPKEMTTLESYLQEYFNRIMKKLRELNYDLDKAKSRDKKRVPF
jgi:uncharacterized protein YbjT (DUF2867 family)